MQSTTTLSPARSSQSRPYCRNSASPLRTCIRMVQAALLRAMRSGVRRTALRTGLHHIKAARAEIRRVQARLEARGLRTVDVDLEEGAADGVDPVGERMPGLDVLCRPPVPQALCFYPPAWLDGAPRLGVAARTAHGCALRGRLACTGVRAAAATERYAAFQIPRCEGTGDDMSAKPEIRAFPLPSSLQVLPGTEKAQAAHPYHVQFAPEDDQRFWFYNSMHFPEPMSHFDMVTAEAAYCALGASNTRIHCLATTLGIDHRIINGRVYIGGNAVTDPAEIARRTGEFQKRAFYYYANWEQLYDQWREKMMKLINESRAMPPIGLPEFEPLAHVHAGRGIGSNHDLMVIYHKTLEGYFRMWHHHFEFLLLGYGAYLTFFGFCKKAFRRSATRPSRAWWRHRGGDLPSG